MRAIPKRYRILRKLGRGGEGSVWLAADRLHGDQPVALKWILPDGAPEDALDGLAREFITLSKLAHPHIARVRDFGRLSRGEGAWFTSEYVPGGNLLEWAFAAGPEDRWRGLAEIALQALSVIRYLALKGLRHGDVKPANLLIDRDTGRSALKVIDFGAARLAEAAGGRFLGTPAYLPSPGAQVDPDLHGLGMALYHASVGRLPFALGEEGALDAWWRAGEPARARAAEPAVPGVLDDLIAGLTATRGGSRFRSAVEAMDWLRGKVSLPPPPRPLLAESVSVSGREDFLDKLERDSTLARRAPGILVISGPPGLGKGAVLEALAARLQCRGSATALFTGLDDAEALHAVESALENGAGKGLPREPAALAAALPGAGSGIAILVHDAPNGSATPEGGAAASFLAEAARLATAAGDDDLRPMIAVATGDPAALARRLGVPEASLRVHVLEPLSRRAIHDIAREFFAVEFVPEEIAQRVEEESGGSPARVQEALEALSGAGVAVGILGEIRIPSSLPERLVRDRTTGSPPSSELSPDLRRALGLVSIAGEPLPAEAAAERFPEWSEAAWRALLESLRTRGLLRLDRHRGGLAYRRTPTAAALAIPTLLGVLGEEEARRALVAKLDGLAAPAPGTLLAMALNHAALGAGGDAVRCALAAARAILRSRDPRVEVDAEALAALAALAAEEPRGHPDRARWALRLRAAKVLDRVGERVHAMDLLRGTGSSSPAWFEALADLLRADVLEGMGEVDAAVAVLEGVIEAERSRGKASQPGPGVDAKARLASLLFRAGKPRRGKDCMEEGRRFLDEVRAGSARMGGARAAGILGLFARSEAAHGESTRAMEMLEEALRLARRAGREDLAAGPLHELGILYGDEGRWADALAVFEDIESKARARADRMGALKALHNQAIIHYRLHDLDRAERLFREARRVSSEMGRNGLEAAVLLGSASVLRERGRLLQSLRLYRRVMGGRIRARPSDRAVAHANVREIYLVLGRLDRSLLHANRAFRLARRVKSRFLEGMTLRFRGIIRSALGRSAEARRDLEQALALARAEGDARSIGAASHHLGVLAAAEGRGDEALRHLREGMAASRSAGDRPHLHAGIVAILGELARRGRTKAARKILGGRTGSATWARGDLAARVLALRTGGRWPSNHGEVAAAAREAAARGLQWDAFRVISDALADPALDSQGRSDLALVRDALAARILRSVPARHAVSFRSFWKLSVPGASDAAREEPSPEPGAPGGSAASVVEFLRGEPRSLRTLATETLRALGARAVWILTDGGQGIGTGETVAAGRGDGLARLLEKHGDAIARAVPGAPLCEGEFLCLALPDPTRRAVLCAQAPAAGFADVDQALRILAERASLISMAIRLLDAESQLASERNRSHDAGKEVRRMNVMAVKEREKLETALMTQRVEIDGLRRRLDDLGGPATPGKAPVGASAILRGIISRLPVLAAREIPVLILGESGVGKDLLARWIHELGPRRERPFAAESCTIPESLMEAELFGFVKGAFTDAVKDRPGLFQRIDGGTLYLDEIADLTLTMQSRLLRVLEEGRVRPLGSEASVPVDFRLISSSRRTLEDLASGERLRRDFFYRVNAEVLAVPPLRERKEDIRPLVEAALDEHARATGDPPPYVEDAAWRKLHDHDWPGNVRELLNEIHRALVGRPIEITADMVVLRGSKGRPEPDPEKITPLRDGRLQVERELILRALRMHRGNVSRAARALRVTRRYLGTLLSKHGIRLEDYREEGGKGGSGGNS